MKRADLKSAPLAIHDGQPVRSSSLPYGRHQISEEDIQAVVEVLRSDRVTSGPRVAEFEEAIAHQVGAKFAVAFSSGTAALHGAAFAANLGPGDDAITTPLTFCASANCVLYTGATPVFSDVSADTLNIDPQQVTSRITDRTKVILPVDYAGHPAMLDELLEIAETNGLVVIEDAAHSLGALYKGRKVGSLSHMTVFSFHPVKHITAGEGGMVTTDNPDFANRLRTFRNHGINLDAGQRQGQEDGDWHYQMEELGYNYRLTDIGSALALSQLSRLSENVARRREIVATYNQAFESMAGVIPPVELSDAESAWHIYPIRLELERFSVGRKEIFQALRAENIEVNVHYIPVHLHPYYRQHFGYEGGEYPVAEGAYERLITLPLFPAMTQEDVQDVVDAMHKVVEYYLSENSAVK